MALLASVVWLVGLLHAAPELSAPAPILASLTNAPVASEPTTNAHDAAYDDIAMFTEALMLVKRQYAEEKDFHELICGAIDGMLLSLDPHSGFLSPEDLQELREDTAGRFSGIGVHVEIKDGHVVILAPIEGSPALRAGLQSGDIIEKIDHVSAIGLSMDDAARRLRGAKGTSVTVTIMREGRDPFDVTLVRDEIRISSVRDVHLARGGVGYIRLTQFSEISGREFVQALDTLHTQKVAGLVIDLRDNPGGLLETAVEITSTLLPKGADIVSVRGRDGARDEERFRAAGSFHVVDIPVAVLVNAQSASASEIMSGALQDNHRAVIVGETTFGKASVQNVIRLTTRSDCAIRLTTAHYFTPAGRMIHGKGIVPDIVLAISPSKWRQIVLKRTYQEMPDAYPAAAREKVADVVDEQLERAIDIMIGAKILETRPR